MYLNDIMLDKLIMNALSEDVGTGDITTESTIPETARAHGLYKAKESGVLCGIGVSLFLRLRGVLLLSGGFLRSALRGLGGFRPCNALTCRHYHCCAKRADK